MNKVLPGLYLGNYRDSKDVAQLERHKITHILAIHDAPRRLFPDKEYLCIMASDNPRQNLSQYFSACNDFIHNARGCGEGNVLVHCLAGMSRSVTIAIAYLMSITSSPLSDAEKMVRGARPISNPNSGFLKQLQEFEGSPRLFEERRRMLEKYPGSTFLESDMEHCKKLLVSHNNHLLSLRHPIKLSPKRTPSVAVSPRHARLSSTRSIDLAHPSTSSNPGSPQKASSTPVSPALSSRMKSTRISGSPVSTPPTLTAPWERHYGCWKDQSPVKNSASSTPASPVHYKVSKHHRTGSVSSVTSIASVASLPAHLQPESPSPGPSVNLDQTNPQQQRVRRRLPQPGRYAPPRSSDQLWPEYPPAPRATPEEEDETLAVVLVEEQSTSRSRWETPFKPNVQQPRRLTSRPTSGITRWVMKRSAFRFTMGNS